MLSVKNIYIDNQLFNRVSDLFFTMIESDFVKGITSPNAYDIVVNVCVNRIQ